MTSPLIVQKQIKTITMNLISCSLCVDQNFPIVKTHNSKIYIKFNNNAQGMLKNKAYYEIYDALADSRSYNIKLLDGAIIQFMYEFDKHELKKHRLAFFSSPHLDEYQNDPDLYEEDSLYSDIIRKDTVPFPIRFDFDCDEAVVKDIIHPASHLTLGQYKECRIPVSAPLTPYQFITFILRNFYNTAYYEHSDSIKRFDEAFDETITKSERKIVHIIV